MKLRVPSHFKWATYQPPAGEDMLPQAVQSSFPDNMAMRIFKSLVGSRKTGSLRFAALGRGGPRVGHNLRFAALGRRGPGDSSGSRDRVDAHWFS